MNDEEYLKRQINTAIIEWGNKDIINHPDYKTATDYIKEGDVVLECGCNSGAYLEHLAEKGHECWGIDLPEIISRIEDSKGVNYLSIDMNKESEIPNKKFDVICAFSFIEHLYNDWGFLMFVKSQLKKNGLFIVSIPTNPNVSSNHVRFYPYWEWLRLIDIAGFKIVEKRQGPDNDGWRIWVLRND